MKNKNSFATGRCPDAIQRADSAGRPQGEIRVSRQALGNTSARPEAMLKNQLRDFSTLSGKPERFTAGGTILECVEFATESAPAPTNFGPGAHSRRSNPMDSRREKAKIMLSHSATEVQM